MKVRPRAWQVGVSVVGALAGLLGPTAAARGDDDRGREGDLAGQAGGAATLDARRAAPDGRRVVVLADRNNPGQTVIADELRRKLHRSHPAVAFEVSTAEDHEGRVQAGAASRRSPPAVRVLLGPAMIDDALARTPPDTAQVYADLDEHDPRLPRLRAQGLVGVVDLCPVESLVRLAIRLMPRSRTVGWLQPEDTRRGPLGATLQATATALGVSVVAAPGADAAVGARLLFVAPAGLFDWPGEPTWRREAMALRQELGAPVVTCSRLAFERGAAVAAFVVEPEEVGEALGRQVAAVLDGRTPVDESIESGVVAVNRAAACAAGATLDAALLARAEVVGDRLACAPLPPSPHRARWAGLGAAGALVAVGALGARARATRRRSARG